MKPAIFDVARAATVEQACELLRDAGRDVKVLAGGQSLVPLLNFRLSRPELLVDLNSLTELEYIREEGQELRVGAMTRLRALERFVANRDEYRLLARGLPHVGHVPIRNRGTVGGSLAHADPAAELGVISLALGARLVARSTRGLREIDAEGFFDSYYTTCLEADEILVEVRFPLERPGTGAAFLEVARRQGDFALVAVAVLLEVGGHGEVTLARLAYGSMGARPLRAAAAEAALIGQPATEESFRGAAEAAVRELEPESDIHASREYRLDIAKALTRRALGRALAVSSARP